MKGPCVRKVRRLTKESHNKENFWICAVARITLPEAMEYREICSNNGNTRSVMYEVKVYNSTGDLKKVISVKALNRRSDKLINSPSLYTNKRKKSKPVVITSKTRKKN